MEKARGRPRCPKMRDKRHEAAQLVDGFPAPAERSHPSRFVEIPFQMRGFPAEDHEKAEAIC